MKIKAKSKFNYKTIKAFTRAGLFRKSDPAKQVVIYCLIAVLLAAVLLVEIFLLGPDTALVIMLIVAVLLLVFELFLYFVLPRLRYNSLGSMKGCVNEFVFRDEYVLVTANDNGFSGESRIDYDVIARTVETSKYFYIFQTKNQALIVEKSTFSGGTPTQLREKLRTILGDRYVIYKY